MFQYLNYSIEKVRFPFKFIEKVLIAVMDMTGFLVNPEERFRNSLFYLQEHC